MHGDGARVQGARCRGPGQSAITVHGDGVRVKGTGAERDNRARGRCTGVWGRCRKGTGAERDNGRTATVEGARGQCTGVRGRGREGTGQSAVTVCAGARVHGKVQEGGRAR